MPISIRKHIKKTLDEIEKRGVKNKSKLDDARKNAPEFRIKKTIKERINSITPEQKAKAKKIAIKALKIAGVVAISAAATYAGYAGISALNAGVLKKLSKSFTETSALAATRAAAEKQYIADFTGRTGYQRLLDMVDRHPGSKIARKAADSAYKQTIKNHNVTADLRSVARISGNKLSYYGDPSIRWYKKLLSQVGGRPEY